MKDVKFCRIVKGTVTIGLKVVISVVVGIGLIVEAAKRKYRNE